METNQLSHARTAFKRAVFVLGGQAKMAKLLDISQQAVSHRMIRTNAPVQTLEEIERIEAATGVSRHDLRPDLYPREDAPPAPHPTAQHPAAHPSAPASSPLPDAGVDGSGALKGLAA